MKHKFKIGKYSITVTQVSVSSCRWTIQDGKQRVNKGWTETFAESLRRVLEVLDRYSRAHEQGTREFFNLKYRWNN